MIQLNLSQLEQVEYLFYQSSQGNHILFDVKEIRNVFSNSLTLKDGVELDEKKIDEIKSLLETLMYQPTLKAKKQFIDSLPENDRNLLIRAYFSLLDTTLQNDQHSHH